LLNREKIEIYEKDLSLFFEVIAENFIESPFWYDGAVGLSLKTGKQRQIIFDGKMWTAKDAQKQWLEPFGAIITDKRITKQGIWIKIWVGEYYGEGELLESFKIDKAKKFA
jgi:hypothetical protein